MFLLLGLAVSAAFSHQYYEHILGEELNKKHKIHEKLNRDFELSLEQYIHPLEGIASTLHYSDLAMSASNFRKASEARGLYSDFKGALGFGFIRRVPQVELKKYLNLQKIDRSNFQLKRITGSEPRPSENEDLYVIEFVEPVERNSKAVGLVVSDSIKRQEAAYSSMVSGLPTITESVQLVQSNKPEPGFLLYFPIYKSTRKLQSQHERLNSHVGWAYAPLLLSEIVDSIRSQNYHTLPMQIASKVSNGTIEVFFESADFKATQGKIFSDTLILFGQSWILSTAIPQSDLQGLYLDCLMVFCLMVSVVFVIFIYLLHLENKISFSQELEIRSQEKVEAATAQLSEQKYFLQNLIDELPAMVAFWEKDFRLRLSNAQFKKFLRGRSTRFEGLHMCELLGEELFSLNRPFAEMALKGFEQEFERQLTGPDGDDRTVLLRYTPHWVGSVVNGFSVIALDITEIRKLEAKNQETQALLFTNSKLSLLGEMAAGVAHEINNPLSVINGRSALLHKQVASLLVDEDTKDKMQNNIKIIAATIDRIAKIIRGLKSFARNAENDPFDQVSLKEVVDETLSLTFEKLKKQNVAVGVIGFEGETMAHCNKTQIEQVLMNLLSNSADAISDFPEKWIKIILSDAGNKFEFRVVDAGIGIPSRVAEKIMNPFYTTKDVGKGTGLGLSISSSIVKKHGSQLRYELFDGHTSFYFQIEKSGSKGSDTIAS